MSGPTFSRAGQIDLRLSPASKKSLDEYRASMEATAKRVGELTQDLKNLKKVTDGIKTVAFADNGNLKGYLDGVKAQQRQKIGQTTFAGSQVGQQIASSRDALKQQRDILGLVGQTNTLLQARGRTIAEQRLALRGINDLEQLRIQKLAAQEKMASARAQGTVREQMQAQRLNDLVDQRISKVQQLEKANERAAKAEQRRANTIQQNLRGDPELERSRAVAGRRATLERVNGDGGAGLFQVQSAVLANYAVMGTAIAGIKQGIEFSAQFDEALRNLQAIVVVTDENLGGLKEKFLDVSEATKFTAVEIANAAVTLGQAGFSSKEIDDSIEAVALLATATGTDLAKSVDIATSVLGVFNMESSQMAGVANTLTAAVNGSKLNIDKLTLGLQYAGNTAAQSGVSFEELTASLGAMANAGIRSGSTLGTGMRQILISLQKPSKEFVGILARLGLSMADVDLQSNGLYGALQKLRDAGFTSADAINAFEVRAASAFNALSGNIEDVVRLERSFLNSQAAAKANDTQMRALSNQSKRFGANLGALVSTGLEPLLMLSRDVLWRMSDLLEVMRQFPGVVKFGTTALVSLGVAFAGLRLARLAIGLAGTVTGFNSLKVAAASAAVATGSLGKSMAFMRALAGGPVIALASAVALGAVAYRSMAKEGALAATAVEQAQSRFDRSSGAVSEYADKLGMVEGKITDLANRHGILTENQNLLDLETDKVREQFRDMGIELGDNVGSVEDLITALKALRGELAGEYKLKIERNVEDLRNLIQTKETERGLLPRANYLLADRTAGDDAQLLAANQIAANPKASLDQLYAARDTAQSRMDLYESGGDVTRGQNNMAAAIERVTTAAIEAEGSLIGLRRELSDTERNDAMRASINANADLDDRVSNFNNAAMPVMTEVVSKNDDKPAMDLYEAGLAAQSQIRQDYEAIRADVEGRTDLDEEVRADWLRELDNTMSEVDAATGGLAKGASDAAEASAELAAKFRSLEKTRLEDQLGNARTPKDAANAFLSLQQLNTDNLQGRRNAAIEQRRTGAIGPGEFAVEMAEAAAEYSDANSAANKALEEQLEDIAEERTKAIIRATENLGRHLDVARSRAEAVLERAETPEAARAAGERLEGLNQAQLLNEIDALDAQNLDPETYASKLAEIEQNAAERSIANREATEDAVEAIVEEEVKQQRLLLSNLRDRLKLAEESAEDTLRNSSSRGEAAGAAKALRGNAESQRLTAIRDLDAQGLDPDSYATQLAQIEREFENRSKAIDDQTVDTLERIARKEIDDKQRMIANLQRRLDLSGRESESVLDTSDSRGEIAGAAKTLRGISESQRRTAIEDLDTQGLDEDSYATALAEIEQENKDRLARINDLTAAALGRIAKDETEAQRQTLRNLRDQFSLAERDAEAILREGTERGDLAGAAKDLRRLNENQRITAIRELDLQQLDPETYEVELAKIEAAADERGAEISDMTADGLERIVRNLLDQQQRTIDNLRQRLQLDADQIEEQMETVGTRDGVRAAQGDLDANAQADFGAASQGLTAQLDAKVIDQDSYDTQLAVLKQNLEQRIAQNADKASRAVGDVIKTEQDALAVEMQTLETDLREAGSLEEREGIREAIRANIQAQADRAAELAEETIQGQADLDNALAAIAADERAQLLGVEEASQADKLEDAEKTLSTAQTALEEVLQLAADAETLRERNEFLKEAMVRLANVASAAQGVADVKTENGDGTAEENQGEVESLMAGLNRRVNNIRRSRLPTDRSGGPKKKKEKEEDPVDKLIDDLTGQLEAAKKMVEIGETSGFSFDGTILKATQELDKITAQIRAMNGRLLNGGSLTVKEQEKLNTLTEQHGKLTAFIKGQEEEIARIKISQGDYAGGLVTITENWAAQNLNMTNIMVSGFQSAMSQMQNSTANFFSEWFNGTERGMSAFKKFGYSVVQSIQGIISQMIAAAIIQKALGWLMPGADLSALNLGSLPSFGGGGSGGQTRPKARPAAAGGEVRGPLRRDSQLYNLMPGEYVMRASAAQAIGRDNLDQMNAMGNSVVSKAGNPAMPKASDDAGNGTVNVWVVAPDQQPTMGPNDVLAVISDDITTGGQTKKLIKSVQMGY